MRRKILLIEDDPQTINLLTFNLRNAGFQVVVVSNAPSALLRADEDRPSLVLLGLAFPQVQAFEACRQLKESASTRHAPLIIVTGQAEEQDRILGFELGADDYIPKPFNVLELILRVRKSLQRMTEKLVEPPAGQRMIVGELALDTNRHEVTIKNEPAHLTPIEFRLLSLLMGRSGCAVGRETLLTGVWGPTTHADSRAIDAHIKRLRQKLGQIGSAIETITGFGYRLSKNPVPETESPVLAPDLPVVNHDWKPRGKGKPLLKNRRRSTGVGSTLLAAASVA
jgi:two-component system, OmpR family, phosphate regulon response regulator PhoB